LAIAVIFDTITWGEFFRENRAFGTREKQDEDFGNARQDYPPQIFQRFAQRPAFSVARPQPSSADCLDNRTTRYGQNHTCDKLARSPANAFSLVPGR
jgi:hypothetical protein